MFALLEKEHIPIHWLNNHAFCEYSLFLSQIKKIRAPITSAMLFGAKKHSLLEEEFKKDAVPLEEPIEEYVQKLIAGKAKPILLREFSVKTDSFKLNGRIDQIHLHENSVIIIDNKPSASNSFGAIRQLRAYALCFEEKFSWKKEIFSAICSHSNQVLYSEKFSEKEKTDIKEAVQRMHNLFNGVEEFVPTENPRKCFSCRYGFACRYFKERVSSFLEPNS